jgi:hypothetical protein
MKVRILLLALAALIFIQTVDVLAQESEADPLNPGSTSTAIYLGPVLGYNRSMHSVKLSSFVDDPLCPFFENGSNNGFYAGLSYEQIFGNKVGSKHSLIARVLYSTLPSSFSKEGDVYPSLVDDGKGGYTTVNSSTRHTIEVAYNLICVEIMYKFNAIGNLGLTAGPTFDFPIKKTLVQNYEIVQPDNVQFKRNPDYIAKGYQYLNSDRTIQVMNGDIPGASGFRFGLKFGLQYEIITGAKYYIVPAVYYNLGLTNVTTKESWKVNALQAGVDVRFAL